MYFCFIDYTKASDWVDHNKLQKILQEIGTPDHLTCLLRRICIQVKNQQLEPDKEQFTVIYTKALAQSMKQIFSEILLLFI